MESVGALLKKIGLDAKCLESLNISAMAAMFKTRDTNRELSCD